jgi:hypothetical protein
MEHSGTEAAAVGEEQGTARGAVVRVLLADDHSMFREGLASMLASSYAEEVEVVGKTAIGEEAVSPGPKREAGRSDHAG